MYKWKNNLLSYIKISNSDVISHFKFKSSIRLCIPMGRRYCFVKTLIVFFDNNTKSLCIELDTRLFQSCYKGPPIVTSTPVVECNVGQSVSSWSVGNVKVDRSYGEGSFYVDSFETNV